MAVGASIATLGNILKEFYLPPVVEQLNNELLLFNRLEKSAEELRGIEAYVPLHTGRSTGIGPAAENFALPAAGSQGYGKAVYDIRPQYGRLRITGLAMEKTAKDSGAFLQGLKGEIDGLRADLRRESARMSYQDGTGQIAQCGTTTASTTVVLASKEALRKGWLYVGMVVDIGTAADNSSLANGVTITAVNIATPSITVSGSAITTSSSHFVARTNAAISSTGKSTAITAKAEFDGLSLLVAASANTVGGINSASAGNEFWQNLVDSTTSTLSSDALVQNMNQVAIAGGEIDLMISSYGMQRKLFGLLQSQVRYVDPMTLKGGFSTLEFNGKPFVADRDAPYGKIFLLDTSKIKVFRNQDWHFLEEDGNVLKWVVGFDAWEAVLAQYLNFGITRRNTQLIMSNLAGDDPNGF